jgi:hypothetical protein
MRSAPLAAATVLLLLACGRGEPVPRDYQNAPPAMTHPVTSSTQTPTANGMPGPRPEPSYGAEGTAAPNKPVSPIPPTLTLKDQPPIATTDSQHAAQTTSTAATGTHLSSKP